MKQPIVHFIVFTSTSREGELVVVVVLINEVMEYGARFEKSDRIIAGRVGPRVGYSWNTTIGIDFEEPRLLLGILGDIYWDCFVWLHSCQSLSMKLGRT